MRERAISILKEMEPLLPHVAAARVNSREICQGDIFFALNGQKVDGHAYLSEVAQRGAAAAVVRSDYCGEDFGLILIRVDDVLDFLQGIAKAIMAESSAKKIAITGSVGKTTTKEFLAHLLTAKYRVYKTPGNANSQIGLPLSILNSPEGEEVFIAEMGMTSFGHISRLLKVFVPDLAILTKVALAHVSFFEEGIEGIAKAKAEILSHPQTKLAVINRQAHRFDAIREGGACERCWVGEGGDYQLRSCEEGYLIMEKGRLSPSFSLPFKASHLLENFLVAAASARMLGLNWEEITQQASSLQAASLRFEVIERHGISIINDCYNANPESVRAALENLPATLGKTIAVLGEMADLGVFSFKEHVDIARLALEKCDHLLCYGEESRPMAELFLEKGKPAEWFNDKDALRARLFCIAKPGDLVLIKGKNGNGLWNICK